MKNAYSTLRLVLLAGCLTFTINACIQDHVVQQPTSLAPTSERPFATGLKSPIGLTQDLQGNVWVTEAGSGTAADGQVSVVTPDGSVYPAITGFHSEMSPENSPEGLNHLVFREGKLYILSGVDEALYIADVSAFMPGTSAPIASSSLKKIKIGDYVRGERPNAPDDADSNPYGITFGADWTLFITDAGANAVIKLDLKTEALSVYAKFPDVPNPTYPNGAKLGPPTIDAVPTGIVFDGRNLFLTTLNGFPFPDGLSKIYKIDTWQSPVAPVVAKDGFSPMTSLAFAPNGKLLVTEFGFSAAGGRVASGENPATTVLAPAITPVDILLSTAQKDIYFLLSYGPGIITKLKAN